MVTSRPAVNAAERFWSKVVKGPAQGDCWLWAAAVGDDGYGRFTLNADGRTVAVRPHRFAFHLLHGSDLDAFGPLMHTCDVPICVHATADTLTHLVEGTSRSNMLDRLAKGRDANGSSFRWRGLARAQFAARSVALRDEVRAHGWDRPQRVTALLAGVDPDAPTLF
ncbi:hypothetical protein [Arthrobacter bambusae]|uniref:hypothetical protein n=1 Tax=Arthrobacter bambusae TaxID=1338426 RepID=UPI00277E0AD3|nr:hypothetical protein [Arthrobacter bambusae]MDQ0212201.1 hypothetical protein [Arthrobacter bambusae]MDQ0236580.1 hypothetical protein [Arthrobacter bambusae]